MSPAVQSILLSLVLCGLKEAKIFKVLALETGLGFTLLIGVWYMHMVMAVVRGMGPSVIRGGQSRALGVLRAHSHLFQTGSPQAPMVSCL